MRQVPQKLSYGILGDGRVARHFSHYFNLLEIDHFLWSRRLGSDRPILGDCLLVLVSDSAIESLIQEHPEIQQKTLIHFSGSLVTPLARSAHPLLTYGNTLYSLPTYESIPFMTEIAEPEFRSLFPFFSNPVFFLNPELKPLYHALCVLGGNFSALLWKKVFKEFETKLNLPHSVAEPYLRAMTQNLINAPFEPTPGPFLRNDKETIQKNLNALTGDPYQQIYKGFMEANCKL